MYGKRCDIIRDDAHAVFDLNRDESAGQQTRVYVGKLTRKRGSKGSSKSTERCI